MKRFIRILETLCALMGLFGAFKISQGQPLEGFIISTISSLLFIIYNALTKQYMLLITSIVYFVINLNGVKHWLTHH